LLTAELLRGSQKPTSGPQWSFLNGILDLSTFISRSKMLRDSLVSVTDRQHKSMDALVDPIIELIFKKGAAADRSHRLRKVRHGAAQPGPQPAGKNHGRGHDTFTRSLEPCTTRQSPHRADPDSYRCRSHRSGCVRFPERAGGDPWRRCFSDTVGESDCRRPRFLVETRFPLRA